MKSSSPAWPVILLLFLITACSPYPDGLTPEEALEAFEIKDGFKVEVYAAEPFVKDPVEMVFDERGRVFVVEMPDYPYKPAPGEGLSRIVQLEDTDQDGRIDKQTVFVDSLSEATSALPWDGGLIVTAAPHIWYYEDTDGDGAADTEEILFSGFFENNSEAQITNLRFSVDNWIYASNFGQAGTITSTRNPDAPPLDVSRGDFRFRLDTNEFEVAAGPTQFGQGLDDWGNRFVTHNTTHISHLVIPWRYLHRHPHLPDPVMITNISDHDLRMYQRTPAPYWRAERTRRRQARYDEAGSGRIEYAADHFTGASGSTVYDGTLFPESFYGNVFTGDVAGNLIHRDVLVPLENSPTFVAQRASDETDREFIATVDSWFRPASFSVGPNGALYVVDMYRQHIETPLSIPEDLKAEMDFYNGDDRGRIYRISPASSGQAGPFPNLGDYATEELIALLEHKAGWTRRTAHRLIIERQDNSIVPALRNLFNNSPMPQARLHALYALHGLGALTNLEIQAALDDAEAGVRVHAIRLAEGTPSFHQKLVSMVDDASPHVALQAVLSLGSAPNNDLIQVFADFLTKHLENKWMQLAVLSSETGSSIAFLEAMRQLPAFEETPQVAKDAFLKMFAELIVNKHAIDELANFNAMFPDLAVEAPTTNSTP